MPDSTFITVTLEVLPEGHDANVDSGLTEDAYNSLMNALGHWDFFSGVDDIRKGKS